MVLNQTKVTYIVVRFMKSDMFGIGRVNLLLLKSLHIQGANTHESKEELVILTSNNLFPCFHKKIICTWLVS
jgi:hypothetical protein